MGKLSKLRNYFKEAHFTFFHWVLLVYVFFIPLWPKIPFMDVEYTYINIRYEDLFVAIVYIIFAIELLRRKLTLKKNIFLTLILAYWGVVFASTFIGHYVLHTVPVLNIGLLHAFRRIEYMLPFIIFFTAVHNARQFRIYLYGAMLALAGVGIYGLGQKFLGFPAYLTMNPVFSTGIPLNLTEESRLASTFGGHYDLAAFLVLLIPMSLGLVIIGKKMFITLYLLALLMLGYTASRTSSIAYAASTIPYVLWMRRFKLLLIVLASSILLILFAKDLTARFKKTFTVRVIFVNTKTGANAVAQKQSKDELPAGNVYVKLKGDELKKKQAEELLRKQLEAATKSGVLTASEAAAIASGSGQAQDVTAVSGVALDISSTTRIQVEWPRAIAAFKKNPVSGTGPSSITEATDNGFLRALGETGILGFMLLYGIVFMLQLHFFKAAYRIQGVMKPLLLAVIFGTGGLMINTLYIDILEASKIAFFVWFYWALFYKSTFFNKSELQKAFGL